MAKMFVLIPKKPGLADQDFHHHWLTTHAALARRITALDKYCQSHADPDLTARLARKPFAASGFLGVSEAWFRSADEALSMTSTAEYRDGALPDEENFMDVANKARLFTTKVTSSSNGPERPAPVKLILLSERRRDVDADTFARHWAGEHTGTLHALPRLAGHTQRLVDSRAGAASLPDWSFVDELWWRTESDLRAAWASPATARLLESARRLATDRSVILAARERRIIWP
jgi:hypothetical protein